MGKVTRAFFLYPVVLAACVPDGADDIDTRTGNILNGQPVAATNNPGAVALYYKVRVNGQIVDHPRPCTGVLISRTFVLTAMHCVTEDGSLVRSRILAGSNYAVTGPDNVAPGLTRPPSAVPVRNGGVLLPPSFGSGSTSVDLAVLHVSSEFPASARTLPARLVPRWNGGDGAAMVGQQVDAFGFGRSQVGQSTGSENPVWGAGTLRRTGTPLLVNAFVSSGTLGSLYRADANAAGQVTWHGDSGGPDYLAGTSTLAGIHTFSMTHPNGVGYSEVTTFDRYRAWIKKARHSPGDINRDRRSDNALGRADLALVGAATPAGIVVGLSDGAGGFTVPSVSTHPDFKSWSRQAGARVVAGDFNGDGYQDFALTGGIGWQSVPTAIYQPGSMGGPFFAVNNFPSVAFAAKAQDALAQPVAGDFNGDGWVDIALPGAANSPPGITVALSNSAASDGTFTTATYSVFSGFADMSRASGVKALSGDFDGDDIDDIALASQLAGPAPGINGIPIAFASSGAGNPPFGRFVQVANATFLSLIRTSGARAVVGDYNGDGRDDIAVVGGVGWLSVPVMLSQGASGNFTFVNEPLADFPIMAQAAGARPVAGDFDGDGDDDLALSGGVDWASVPVAMSRGDGSFFTPTNTSTSFAISAREPATILSGH